MTSSDSQHLHFCVISISRRSKGCALHRSYMHACIESSIGSVLSFVTVIKWSYTWVTLPKSMTCRFPHITVLVVVSRTVVSSLAHLLANVSCSVISAGLVKNIGDEIDGDMIELSWPTFLDALDETWLEFSRFSAPKGRPCDTFLTHLRRS